MPAAAYLRRMIPLQIQEIIERYYNPPDILAGKPIAGGQGVSQDEGSSVEIQKHLENEMIGAPGEIMQPVRGKGGCGQGSAGIAELAGA